MVIVEVSQGLGNQLFMYACAYAVAKMRGGGRTFSGKFFILFKTF